MRNANLLPLFAFVFSTVLAIVLGADDNHKLSQSLFVQSPQSLTYDELLSTYATRSQTCTRKYSSHQVLGFVTPWNPSGKEESIAEAQNGRLDIVSPVTWQMLPHKLDGGTDFDNHYFNAISSSGCRIYPRILFEPSSWSCHSFITLSSTTEEMVERLVSLCRQYGFDGVVLEIWQAIIGSACMEKAADKMIAMVTQIGEALRNKSLHTALVLYPYTADVNSHHMNSKTLRKLSLGFSYFVVMTYDYGIPNSGRGAAPNAPMWWVRKVATYFSEGGVAPKLLIGLNMYGVEYVKGGEDRHVTGRDVVEMMHKYDARLVWTGEEVGEHAFVVGDGERVTLYPTRASVALRVALAAEMGLGGVALWEMGQGMPYLFDEL